MYADTAGDDSQLQEWQPLSRPRSNTWPTAPAPDDHIDLQKQVQHEVHKPQYPPGPGLQRRAASFRRPQRRKPWGSLSYAELIEKAISSAPEGRLTLAQIYEWLTGHVPYFGERSGGPSSVGWKNSVRHNLSLYPRFVRLHQTDPRSSGLWTLDLSAPQGRSNRRRAGTGTLNVTQQHTARRERSGDNAAHPALTTATLPAEELFRTRASTVASSIVTGSMTGTCWQTLRTVSEHTSQQPHVVPPFVWPDIEATSNAPCFHQRSSSSPWSRAWTVVPDGHRQCVDIATYQNSGFSSQIMYAGPNNLEDTQLTLSNQSTHFRPRSSSTTSSCFSNGLSPAFSSPEEESSCKPTSSLTTAVFDEPMTPCIPAPNHYLPSWVGDERNTHVNDTHAQLNSGFRLRSTSIATPPASYRMSPTPAIVPKNETWPPNEATFHTNAGVRPTPQTSPDCFWNAFAGGTSEEHSGPAGFEQEPSLKPIKREVEETLGSLEGLSDLQLDVQGSFGCDVGELASAELHLEGVLDFESSRSRSSPQAHFAQVGEQVAWNWPLPDQQQLR